MESDIQITAGTVTASGSVNYLGEGINPEWSDDVEIILVPKDGFVAPSVSATKGGGESWDGTWSVDLEPGRYVLQVRDTSRNLVAFSEIFAEFAFVFPFVVQVLCIERREQPTCCRKALILPSSRTRNL